MGNKGRRPNMTDGDLQVRWSIINELLDKSNPRPMSRGPAMQMNEANRTAEIERMGYQTMPMDQLQRGWQNVKSGKQFFSE
jgi:hypothetical protein